MFCPQCGRKLAGNEKFCQDCGKDLSPLADRTKCPKCGATKNDGNFCTKCGARYQYASVNSVSIDKPKDNTSAALLIALSVIVGILIVFLAIYYS